ncbi:MAG: DUF4185 domain-containing protein [Acidobacteriota bacterium]
MPTRRVFLKQTAAAGVAAVTSLQLGCSPESAPKVTRPARPRIKSAIRREETVVRHGGNGDNWHMSWADDDRQYVSLCDGFGWFENPEGAYNSRLFAISDGARDAQFHDLPGYPGFRPPTGDARYYNFGTLALDGHLYQYLSTFNIPPREDLKPNELRFIGAKLIYSPDNGRTWHNQDGSTPVVWEPWDRRSRQTMVFFEEPQEAFSLLTVLQMGRNYEHNQDGFVYVYAPNGNTEGTMNELVMFRVPKKQILDRGAYQYFAGLGPEGGAKWSKDIAARAPVHTFPRGWVNTLMHPYAWHPSVAYNAPLDVYMMANWGMGTAADGMWFGKPSYLGLWTAPKPWGPWTQIHEETAWTPAEDAAARAYQPQIAPKWIAPDGQSFWLVWTDFQEQEKEAFDQFYKGIREKRQRNQMTAEDWKRFAEMVRQHRPYYAFNVQRVDLVTE